MNTLFLIKYLKHKRITVYQLSKRTGLNESNLGKALDLNEHEFAELCGYRKDDKDEEEN